MKKVWSVLLFTAVILVVFAGCGKKSAATPSEQSAGGTEAASASDSASLTPLEALDIVKSYIAGDDDSIFEPLDPEQELTYRFKNSNRMIQYDSGDDEYYVIHDYEVVVDDPATGEGHTATSNWYKVDIHTKEVIPMFSKDGGLNEAY